MFHRLIVCRLHWRHSHRSLALHWNLNISLNDRSWQIQEESNQSPTSLLQSKIKFQSIFFLMRSRKRREADFHANIDRNVCFVSISIASIWAEIVLVRVKLRNHFINRNKHFHLTFKITLRVCIVGVFVCVSMWAYITRHCFFTTCTRWQHTWNVGRLKTEK